jgi:hypothetical protein
VQARDAVQRRSWSHPQEPTSEEWWGDVLADPRARRREHRANDLPLLRAFYTLADEKRETILVACRKCDWKAAFRRDELIASHGRVCPMPNLLDELAAPGCPRLGSTWIGAGCIMSSRSRGLGRSQSGLLSPDERSSSDTQSICPSRRTFYRGARKGARSDLLRDTSHTERDAAVSRTSDKVRQLTLFFALPVSQWPRQDEGLATARYRVARLSCVSCLT